jgi:hypothetical protein
MTKFYATKPIAQAQATRLTNKTGETMVVKNDPTQGWFVEAQSADDLADPTETMNTEEYLEHLGATPMEAALDAQVDEESALADTATMDAVEAELIRSPGIPTNGLTDLDRLLIDHVRASKTCGRGSNSCIDECYTNEELAQLFRDYTITKRRHALKLVRQIHLSDLSARRNARIEAKAAA